ncbi:MAG: UPF0149 family protein [Gammaproteobacteria bacterium]|nr:UPF0149 family protein [Gammaproteobacteria bacterium]MCY4219949.1 UPF0149 family protein [Gammaproteobacteria bacterium]
MSEQNTIGLYASLDQKLRELGWWSGVSEAHGLLTGLACRGISAQHIGDKLYLFELESKQGSETLEALYEMVLQKLESDNPVFDLMLPEDDESISRRSDEIANWCSGFTQGFCHDGELEILQETGPVKEMFDDILSIAGIQYELPQKKTEQHRDDQALCEIEEYLRIGVQLIYEEMTTSPNS